MNKILSYIAERAICIATICSNIATMCLSLCLSEFTMKHIALSNDTSLKIIVNSFAEFQLPIIYTILLLFIIENFKKNLKNKKK